MDIFCGVSVPWEEIYTERALHVKSPLAGLKFVTKMMAGAKYCRPYAATVAKLHDLAVLRSLGMNEYDKDTDRCRNNAEMFVQFVLSLLREMGIREFGAIGQPPFTFLLMLSDDLATALEARDKVLVEHVILVEAENRLSRWEQPLDSVQPLLADLTWEEWTMIRLMFAVVKEEKRTHPDEIGPNTKLMLDTFFRKMPDGKGAEDLHQHGRDVSRQQQWKNVSMPGFFNAVIESGVLDERSADRITVPLEELAAQGWNAASSRQKHGVNFHKEPVNWPFEFNRLLDPLCSYSAPIVTTIFNSMLAWRRLLHVGTLRKFEDGPRSWPSRLLKHGDMILMQDGREYVVLTAGRWGALICWTTRMDGEQRRIYAGESSLDIVFLLESEVSVEWPLCAKARGAPSVDGFILEPSEPHAPLLRVCCLRRHEFSFYDCDRLSAC